MAGGDAVCQALNFDGETTVRRIQTLHEELA
jgi:carbamoyl-phosphate synthase large subunit